MARSKGRKITETGHFITVHGEKIKVGILRKAQGNARIFREKGCTKIKGVFALVQWFRRSELLEKIAYNTAADSIRKAKIEMANWIPKLQYPEFKESSKLIKIFRHNEKSPNKAKAKHVSR